MMIGKPENNNLMTIVLLRACAYALGVTHACEKYFVLGVQHSNDPPTAIQCAAASQLSSSQAASKLATRNPDARSQPEAGLACCQQPETQTVSHPGFPEGSKLAKIYYVVSIF